jgi:dolichol-phosphate mannosyltransferase
LACALLQRFGVLSPTLHLRLSDRFVATDWDRPLDRSRDATVDLSVILPTYNERENLPELFARIDDALAGVCFEVIVADDDSPDQTWALAQEFQKHYPWLRVIRRRKGRGLAAAVLCGFRHACGRVLGVMDADLQHAPELLPELFEQIEDADFAVATRRSAGGSNGKWSKFRRAGSEAATALARSLAQTSFSDPMSGFFLMRRAIFQLIDEPDLRPRGYKILVYLYAKAMRQLAALKVAEVGYEFGVRTRGRSKLSIKIVAEYLMMLIGLRVGARLRRVQPRQDWSRAAS